MRKPLPRRAASAVFALLSKLFRKFGYRLERLDDANFFEPLLYRRLNRSPDFFFIQVGANDGISADPIRDFVTRNNVAGIALEPLPDIFAKLVSNYRAFPKVTPVNLALHRSEKEMTLYRVDPRRADEVGGWSHGIGSFNREHHALSRTPGDVMIEQTVNCISFDELLSQHQVQKIDLLQIDTEGYDAEILKMLDFSRVKPALIHLEHGLAEGVMSEVVFRECVTLLLDQGYYLVTEPYDLIAYQPGMV